MKKITASILALTVMITALCSCSNTSTIESVEETQTAVEEADQRRIPFRFASAEEGRELMLANTEYYAGFSQNDLDFKMAQSGATMEDYLEFAARQVLDFTEEEQAMISSVISEMEQTLDENGYVLPPLDEIIFIKTTMLEEPGAGGYTHGTQIYLGSSFLSMACEQPENERIYDYMHTILWHELFHCLTRCNPDFREAMYSLINFTVEGEDFVIPPSVFEYHISNPDVEHHDSYATFIIDGEPVDCFTDFVTTMHFDEAQSDFFSVGTTALIPVDGTDTYYTPDQASNFSDVFGQNTGYVIDPEECMADNFSFAMYYGIEGPEGESYSNPEIIEGIIDYLTPGN